MNPNEEQTDTTIYEVTHAIQKELGEGLHLGDFITADKIATCTALVQQAADDFFKDALADLEQLENLADGTTSHATFEELRTSIYNIKSFAKVLGFTLITETCIHCLATIDNDNLPEYKKRALLGELVKVLRVAFNQRIRDDGGAIGSAMLTRLRSLR